jgi:hypothetical protein
VRANLADAWNELRNSSPAWAEVIMAGLAIASGIWSYVFPYASQWFQAPSAVCALSFILVGVLQLVAFLSRNGYARRNAAGIASAFWAGVFVVLWQYGAQGLMFGQATVGVLAQLVMHGHLRIGMERRAERERAVERRMGERRAADRRAGLSRAASIRARNRVAKERRTTSIRRNISETNDDVISSDVNIEPTEREALDVESLDARTLDAQLLDVDEKNDFEGSVRSTERRA